MSALPQNLPPVASASSSVSPSPFAPPSGSLSHREAVIPTAAADESVVGKARGDANPPGDSVPRVESMDSDVEMRVVSPGPEQVCPIRPDVLLIYARMQTPCVCDRITPLPRARHSSNLAAHQRRLSSSPPPPSPTFLPNVAETGTHSKSFPSLRLPTRHHRRGARITNTRAS